MRGLFIHIVYSDSPYLQEFSMERYGESARLFQSFEEINVALRIAGLHIPDGTFCETVYLINHDRKTFQGSFYLRNIQNLKEVQKPTCLLHDFQEKLHDDLNINSFDYTIEKSEKARAWLRCLKNFT